ncbi:hypothetical protein [Salisediminibacterium halotolerans]|uniref:Uncharacterized protein n=1 Tax=Salisediminibacterium halotolerans TaxID=517425 RepID=A0A1H9U8P4_9BACI|nr:hypothetical protein [Salisediminibacterium haloalkalitolerans]SES05835.1 hypothetical protein SAMN05444126_11333 [Salisediminibacterium haloalkalitolerans]
MNLAPYLIVAGIICLIALVATFVIGFGPDDSEYEDQSAVVRHWSYVTLIYVLAFVPMFFLIFILFML